jgi:hypothetical protein
MSSPDVSTLSSRAPRLPTSRPWSAAWPERILNGPSSAISISDGSASGSGARPVGRVARQSALRVLERAHPQLDVRAEPRMQLPGHVSRPRRELDLERGLPAGVVLGVGPAAQRAGIRVLQPGKNDLQFIPGGHAPDVTARHHPGRVRRRDRGLWKLSRALIRA